MTPYRCLCCEDQRWVCAAHADRTWAGLDPYGCDCGAEGVPCPACNTGFPAADPAWSEVIADNRPKPH